MKTYSYKYQLNGKHILTLILVLQLLSSCAFKIPVVNNTDSYHQSSLGSYIEVKIKENNLVKKVKGELIAVNDDKLLLKTTTLPVRILDINKTDIKSYHLYYAKNDKENYKTWTGVLWASTISHGLLSIITLPINFITGLSVSSSVTKSSDMI